MKCLVIHGPNLNMLGKREPDIYGETSLDDLNKDLQKFAAALDIDCECFQSNHEGDIVDMIQQSEGVFDGIVINPAAYTHTSVAIRDAILSVSTPVVEVHLSDIHSRESFRQHSYIKDVCLAQISGKGIDSYKEGLQLLIS